jgi:hypothetical protein|tara:strand:+ start:253 stop:627 length:375 start_codon:yes stop_codon:yes gene_type:complete
MNLLKPILGIIDTVVDKAIPDRGEAAKLKASLTQAAIGLSETELQSQTSIIVAEAQGESWLQRNWRPLVMLSFAALVAAHWLGFTAENLDKDEVLSLLEIVKVGLGGYVVGRSAEKTMKAWKVK